MQALASRRGLGTCAKTVFCCERNVLCAAPVNVLFFLTYVILQSRSVEKPSPFSRMGREKSLVQDTHCDPGTILLLGTLDALATDYFLEPIAVWNWLT